MKMFHRFAVVFSTVVIPSLVSGIVVSTCGKQKTQIQDTFEELFGTRIASVNAIELIPADQYKAACREVLTSNLLLARKIPYNEDPSWSQISPQMEKIQLGNNFTILEKVLPCEPQVDTNGKVHNFFLADGYKPNTYFLHLQNEEDTLVPFAIAEKGPSIDQVIKLDDPAAIPKAQQEYIDLRMNYQSSSIPEESKPINPLFEMDRVEKLRLLCTIFDSDYFKFKEKVKVTPFSRDFDDHLETEHLYFSSQFQNETTVTWSHDVMKVKVLVGSSGVTTIFYIGWGLRDHTSYVFVNLNSSASDRVEMGMKYYITNLTALPSTEQILIKRIRRELVADINDFIQINNAFHSASEFDLPF